MKDVEAKFREQVEEVVNVPYDKHLHEGGFISFPMMAQEDPQGRDGAGRLDRPVLPDPPTTSTS